MNSRTTRTGAATRAADSLAGTGWHAGARRVCSPNFDRRPEGTVVELVVVHGISLPPGRFGGQAIEQLFTNRLDTAAHPFYRQLEGVRVSSHFLIRRGGELVQFVACGARAWPPWCDCCAPPIRPCSGSPAIAKSRRDARPIRAIASTGASWPMKPAFLMTSVPCRSSQHGCSLNGTVTKLLARGKLLY